ncbi:MAG: hypothetical protein JSU04_02680 [Bdellovibrionales bacterium]|nr:hypothetical protein [Bdellovibrionales bacterium]
MRISKLMMSFVMLASIATAAATASASSACNSRSGVPRTGNTNPERATVSKSSASAKSETTSKVKSHKARK